jgi:hypothetical protein
VMRGARAVDALIPFDCCGHDAGVESLVFGAVKNMACPRGTFSRLPGCTNGKAGTLSSKLKSTKIFIAYGVPLRIE